ncbi:hypothetical protein KUTeg_017083 [Tegillarca granosa]|uniref:Ig-like domain-containing protein n=1 Tax=Tegillarca granosa TaxID=220873 RepID=A0ABQ9ETB1_TEGGR|nr:hypothetical protein KUTeg_017083 [Tegillarca granosa]
MSFSKKIVVFSDIHDISGAYIDVKPKDTWGLLGSDAIITCSVTLQKKGQYVFWKKVHDAGSEVITYDNQTMKADKYEIQGQYDLIIKDVQMEDEGHYDLDAGDEVVRISLSVAVPMQNMTVTWGGIMPIEEGSEANLTCNSTNSRPTANLRWFHGSHDITEQASTNIKNTRVNGSVDIPYLCIADLPGYEAVRTEIAFAPITEYCLYAI